MIGSPSKIDCAFLYEGLPVGWCCRWSCFFNRDESYRSSIRSNPEVGTWLTHIYNFALTVLSDVADHPPRKPGSPVLAPCRGAEDKTQCRRHHHEAFHCICPFDLRQFSIPSMFPRK